MVITAMSDRHTFKKPHLTVDKDRPPIKLLFFHSGVICKLQAFTNVE